MQTLLKNTFITATFVQDSMCLLILMEHVPTLQHSWMLKIFARMQEADFALETKSSIHAQETPQTRADTDLILSGHRQRLMANWTRSHGLDAQRIRDAGKRTAGADDLPLRQKLILSNVVAMTIWQAGRGMAVAVPFGLILLAFVMPHTPLTRVSKCVTTWERVCVQRESWS